MAVITSSIVVTCCLLRLSNSGPLPAQVTVANIREVRFSRNPRIGRVLSEMGYVRELNEGVNRIYDSMEKSMLSEPTYSDTHDTVTLTLTNNISKHEKSIATDIMRRVEREWSTYKETEKWIVSHLFNNYKGTLADFATAAGVNVPAIRHYVNKFVEAGILEKHSDRKRDINALYTFKKK